MPVTNERRILTEQEFAAVAQSHYPEICGLEKPALIEAARRLREYRNKARDLARGRRREQRGKAEPRGANPAGAETGLSLKKEVFSAALKRVNKEIARHDAAARRASQGEIAQRALEMKRANRVRHHPSAGRTARKGMRPVESGAVNSTIDPRQVGSVSQQNKNFQGVSDR